MATANFHFTPKKYTVAPDMAKSSLHKLSEHETYWSLPFNGLRVLQLRIDFAFGMELGKADSEFSLRISTAFTLKTSEGIANYTADRPAELGPALRLFDATIAEAKAFKNGQLALLFSTNTMLSVEPDLQYEAWEMVSSGTRGMRVVSLPGGDLAIWRGTPE